MSQTSMKQKTERDRFSALRRVGARIAGSLALAAAVALAVFYPTDAITQESVLFENSYFGKGQPNDMTGRVVRPVMLDTYLPVDTSDWTVSPITCSQIALRRAIELAGYKTIIQFPPACTLRIMSGKGTFFEIANNKDELVIRGNEDGQTRIVIDMIEKPPRDGWNHTLFKIGSNEVDEIGRWTWTGGYAKGERVIRAGGPVREVYPGDIVRLSTNQWTDARHGYRANHLVVCAQWSDGKRVGTKADCAGVTGNNQVKIDRELPFDMTGESYYFGSISGHALSQLERRGGGLLDRNQIPMHIGIENITVEHLHPMAVDAFNSMVEAHGCMECWMSGVKASAWGNSWLDTGSAGQSSTSRFLVFASDFEGPLWRMRCAPDVTAISNTTPAKVTFSNIDECRSWCSPLEPGVWFPDDFPEPELAGKLTRCSCAGGDCDSSDGRVTVALTDAATDQPIDGAMLNPLAGGWAVQLNAYGIGGVYFSGAVTSGQLVNSSMKNARVGMIQQQGGYETVAFGNYFDTDPEHQQSRCLFTHGGPGSGSLWERNDCDMGYTSYASAAQGHGIGPYHTMLYNRGRDRGPRTSAMSDQCPSGGICVERTNQEGFSNDQMNFLGNFLSRIHRGGPGDGGYALDRCENDGSRGADRDCSLSGSQVPFLMYGMAWIRNVVWGETLGDDDFDDNPTTIKPDYQQGDAIDRRPASWAATKWPTSLAYDRQIEADASWQAPDWWCQESGPFHNGMGAPADDRNGGNPDYSRLPAQIRLEGGTCTPVASAESSTQAAPAAR